MKTRMHTEHLTIRSDLDVEVILRNPLSVRRLCDQVDWAVQKLMDQGQFCGLAEDFAVMFRTLFERESERLR